MARSLVLALVLITSLARPASASPGVLVLFGNERLQMANGLMEAALRAELGLPGADIEYSAEFLDPVRFAGPDIDALWRDFLRRKYAGHDLRALVVVAPGGFDFMMRQETEIFPGLPVVVIAVGSDLLDGRQVPPNYVVLPFKYEIARTVALAETLQPGVTEIVVPAGTSDRDRRFEQMVRSALPTGPGTPPVRYLTGLSLEEMLREVGGLPKTALVLAIPIVRDGAGRDRTPFDTARALVAASGAPSYSPFSNALDLGVVGGQMTTFTQMGQWAGQMVQRLVNGERVADLHPLAPAPSNAVVDWRGLQRWGLDERRVPAGADVQFKALTLWEQYSGLIVTVSSLVLLLAASLVALLIQRRRRDVAETEVHVVRNELAHLTRVSIIGELSASLAHELNQPLTAILSNAQAAERVLKAPQPDLDLIRDIMADITSDDRRASEVIRRLRDLLKKGEPRLQRVHGAEIVDSVLRLARHDLMFREVTVTTSFEAALPPLNGDLVQLQQVLLNLVLNAADAVRSLPPDERRVAIAVARGTPATIKLTVSDRGHGIAEEHVARVFEPFFTTKAEGLGIGLAISRTIAEAHGGRLWASNNPDRGASLHLELPTA